ncbi:MAG: glycosyltransferase, partial [Desulfobacterales bacterium]|nr:glycosyltransferase [Desulfobacterales bacterium]
MTVHNRRDTTLACLKTLFAQQLPQDVELTVYLVDDGSTDGTGAAVARQYPSVRLIRGNGTLYWNGGMFLALGEAVKKQHDF